MFPQIFPPNQHFQVVVGCGRWLGRCVLIFWGWRATWVRREGHSLSRIASLRGALSGVTWVVRYELGILSTSAAHDESQIVSLLNTTFGITYTFDPGSVVRVWGGQKRDRVWSWQSDFGRDTRRSSCRVNSRTRIYSNQKKTRHAIFASGAIS